MGIRPRASHLLVYRWWTSGSQRIGRLLLRLARNRLLAYVVISLSVAGGFDFLDNRQERMLQGHVYKNCVQQEMIKAQANDRILLLRDATNAVVFKGQDDQSRLAERVEAIKPLPADDCTPLRVDK